MIIIIIIIISPAGGTIFEHILDKVQIQQSATANARYDESAMSWHLDAKRQHCIGAPRTENNGLALLTRLLTRFPSACRSLELVGAQRHVAGMGSFTHGRLWQVVPRLIVACAAVPPTLKMVVRRVLVELNKREAGSASRVLNSLAPV